MNNRIEYLTHFAITIAEIVNLSKSIPTGYIYANVIDGVTLDEFNAIISSLKVNGLITVSKNHVARGTPKLAEFVTVIDNIQKNIVTSKEATNQLEFSYN